MGNNGKPGQPMTPEQRAKLPLSKVFAICRQQAHADFGGQEGSRLREEEAARGVYRGGIGSVGEGYEVGVHSQTLCRLG